MNARFYSKLHVIPGVTKSIPLSIKPSALPEDRHFFPIRQYKHAQAFSVLA